MLTQYKNIDQIETSTKSLQASRFLKSKTDLFTYVSNQTVVPNTEILNDTVDNRIELHVYSDKSWISGDHKILFQDNVPEFRDKDTNDIININKAIGFDLYKQFENLQITSGNFRFVLNFFKNLIGSFEQQHLRIDEISPDRTEIRLQAIDSDNVEFLKQITNFIQNVNQTSNTSLYKTYLLNFSRNQCVQFVNSVVIGEYVYVKLQDTLPDVFQEDFKCWIVEEQKNPYVDRVNILAQEIQKTFNQLSNPNWQANYSYNTSTETGLKN